MSKKKSGVFGMVTSGIKLAGLLTVSAVGGMVLYSRFGVDHQMPLPPAVDAERRNFDSKQAGRLNVYVDRQHAGRPLVLLHSINAAPSAMEVKPLFEHYRRHRPVFALELPGFGFSDRSSRPYTPELFADVISDFLENEVGEAADVVALSLTSEFAARAALENPALFHSLALISPTGLGGSGSDDGQSVRIEPATSERIYKALLFPLWSQAIYDVLVSMPSIRYYTSLNFVGEPAEEFVTYAHATAHQPGARYAPYRFLSGILFTWNVRTAIYQDLTRPVLVLYDEDPNVRFDRLPDLLETNEQWRAERIAPSLGLPHWEQLDATTAALNRFWEEVSGG